MYTAKLLLDIWQDELYENVLYTSESIYLKSDLGNAFSIIFSAPRSPNDLFLKLVVSLIHIG